MNAVSYVLVYMSIINMLQGSFTASPRKMGSKNKWACRFHFTLTRFLDAILISFFVAVSFFLQCGQHKTEVD